MQHRTRIHFQILVACTAQDDIVLGQIYLVKSCVRLEAAGLLIGIEYSRVRDSAWIYLTSFVTIRIGVELARVQGNCGRTT